MASLNTTTLADSIKVQYEKRLLVRALPRMPHTKFGNRATLGKFGSYEVRKYGGLSAVTTTLTEGTTPVEQSGPTITTITMTPSYYGAFIAYTDLVEMETYDPFISEVSGILGEQVGLSADSIVRDYLVANATKDYSAGQSARTSLDSPAHDISFRDLVEQLAALETESAQPLNGSNFAMILHPHSFATLQLDPVFMALFIEGKEGGDPLRSGKVGSIMRMDIYVTANAKEYADGGYSNDDVYSAIIIAKDAYANLGVGGMDPNVPDSGVTGDYGGNNTGKGMNPVSLIVKQLGSAGTADPLDQRATIGWRMQLATQILNSAWIRDLEHVNMFSAQ